MHLSNASFDVISITVESPFSLESKLLFNGYLNDIILLIFNNNITE